jgi:spoIIIJ-associated protein
MDERSSSVTVSARSVDDAVRQALQQLAVSGDDVDVEVIKPGSRGLLGLLSEEAVVRVTLKSALSARFEQEESPESADAVVDEGYQEPGQDGTVGGAAEVLQTLLDSMGVRGRVVRDKSALASQTGPEATVLNISGDDLGLLIGRRGETLRDLQFLTCLMVSRRDGHWPNLIVDVEHYKSRREKSLMDLARRMADKVRASAEPLPLEPMPAHERRIVHLALRDDPDVRTESTGLGEKRKVVILPKQ